jgi:hypothetical protein
MAAVGSVTYAEETFGSVKKIAMAWTSSADTGAVSGTLTTSAYNGVLERLVTVPGAAADAPDDNYNVTVVDEDGTDVLMGGGLLRDTANTEQVLASSLGCVANDKLELRVADAGNGKKGTVYLYLR